MARTTLLQRQFRGTSFVCHDPLPRTKWYWQCQYMRFSSTSSSVDAGFLQLWNRHIEEGRLRPDMAQQRVAKRLQRLQEALVGYSNEAFFLALQETRQKAQDSADHERVNQKDPATVTSTEEVATSKDDQEKETPTPPPPLPLPRIPRGLYIHGPVGTGKSLLMDTFYSASDNDHKLRLHFHAFMAHVHTCIHQLNLADLQAKGRNFSIDTSQDHNPIVRVALQLSQSTTLLCLDEFQVTDVADAMILKQLFQVLFAQGTILVATSNRPPNALYEGGLNRGYFMPFIDILQQHCIVLDLQSTVGDYRKVLAREGSSSSGVNAPNNQQTTFTLPNNGVFFLHHNCGQHLMQDIVRELKTTPNKSSINKNNSPLESFKLPAAFGRHVMVRRGDREGLIGIFTFEELCEGDLGASDYRALAKHFSVIALEAIPQLSTYHHNRARRFITLIDELYEDKCALVCSIVMEGDNIAPEHLFSTHQQSQIILEDGASVQVGETLGLEDVQTQGGQPVSTLASVRELSFAFQRAASRITEMTSPRWWNQVLRADGWMH
jgi:peroxisome-assembly ATPase